MFGHQVQIDQNFKLAITSEMRNPHFSPDLNVLAKFVNFYVTLEGLEEQMLSIVISNQKAELEEETIKMRKLALKNIKELKEIENEILNNLDKDIDRILADEDLIISLNNSRKT